jgi:hypothetical protein
MIIHHPTIQNEENEEKHHTLTNLMIHHFLEAQKKWTMRLL